MNHMETLHALDICFDSFVREFRLAKKRIIVPARMVKTIVDPVSGAPRRYRTVNERDTQYGKKADVIMLVQGANDNKQPILTAWIYDMVFNSIKQGA